MTILIRIVNILIIFNLGYWGFYFLVNFFYNIGKIEILIIYLIIGLIIGLLTTVEWRVGHVAKWGRLMNKIASKNNPSKIQIIFIRMISWPLGGVLTIKNFLKEYNTK